MNRRTARTHAADAVPLSLPPDSVAAVRRRQGAARALLGVPLAERIRVAPPVQARAASVSSPAGAARIALALLTAAAGAGVVLGALQSSLAFGIAGAAGLLGAAGWGAIGWWRRRTFDTAARPVAHQGFDDETLRRLDDLLERTAPALPAAQCAQLVDLKDRFTRLSALLGRVDVNEHFTADDRMYVIEALRRYLPDTLLAYLAVPAARRHDQLVDDASTATALLASQLALLQSELQVREDKLGTAASAALLRQQRFLQSKAGSRQE